MSVTIIATPGASNANSYLTLAEAQAYFDSRFPITEWDDASSQEALLVMATRLLDAILDASPLFVPETPMKPGYFKTGPRWTGAASTDTQALAWPRTGMLTRNGFDIASTVIPQDLKNATAELAGQLAKEDRSLDNDAAVQGISSVRAGSVSVAFKSAGIATTKILPDVVWNLLVSSWVTQEEITSAMGGAQFEVIL